ncbi:MAG: hypothetical protein AVDCRST_MAG68-4314 [uncultured Gemmatimonadetes bacterium]|uniref:Lipoprotein n=1 Tax=uncultured Gemmatimonadota bacterium TaxID=203437 RepID=A0A6J4MHT2_9BACT|nr:MAG: hypothetical protein AVDCRST_MAG68-4314 [uncultured Gemmatimonadota bacterium]
MRILGAAALALALAGCAGGARYPARPAPEALPAHSPLLSETLGLTDAWLRHYLMAGRADSALHLLDERRVAPRDELLRQLQRGVVLHHARRWDESNAAFQWAEEEAERRYTRSVTGAAGMVLMNDAVAAYTPPPAEMAMIPYYRMLNYMALGGGDGTLVEARKANAYLERVRRGSGEPCVGEAFVQYLTGLVYAGAGERRDALVSYRQAERGYDACALDAAAPPAALGVDLYRAARAAGVREVADSAAARYRVAGPALERGGDAELVVLVEEGWVAHRAAADIHVPIPPEEVEGLQSGDAARVTESTARVAAHLLSNLAEKGRWGSTLDERFLLAHALDGAHILKMAWAVPRLEACAPSSVRLLLGGDTLGLAGSAADLSSAVARRWDAQRPAMVARMVTRGVAKYLAAREAERKGNKESEALGWLAARAVNLAGNALERADTRSWSLLPDRISVARLTLPPGEHDVRIQVLAADGGVLETVELGKVSLEAGATRIVHRRVWGGEGGRLALP